MATKPSRPEPGEIERLIARFEADVPRTTFEALAFHALEVPEGQHLRCAVPCVELPDTRSYSFWVTAGPNKVWWHCGFDWPPDSKPGDDSRRFRELAREVGNALRGDLIVRLGLQELDESKEWRILDQDLWTVALHVLLGRFQSQLRFALYRARIGTYCELEEVDAVPGKEGGPGLLGGHRPTLSTIRTDPFTASAALLRVAFSEKAQSPSSTPEQALPQASPRYFQRAVNLLKQDPGTSWSRLAELTDVSRGTLSSNAQLAEIKRVLAAQEAERRRGNS